MRHAVCGVQYLLRTTVMRSNATANTSTFEKPSGEIGEYAVALWCVTDESREAADMKQITTDGHFRNVPQTIVACCSV